MRAAGTATAAGTSVKSFNGLIVGRERATAAARLHGFRVLNLESAAKRVVHVVNDGTGHVLEAHGVNKNLDASVSKNIVAFLGFGVVNRHAIGKP